MVVASGRRRVDQIVGQRQVGEGVLVDGIVEVAIVGGEGGAEAVMVVEHAGDAVEAEAVEVVLVQPEAQLESRKCSTCGLP